MLGEYLLKKILDASFVAARDAAGRILKEKKGRLIVSRDDIEESLNLHMRMISNWSGEVHFNDLEGPKNITDVFVELDLFLYPRRVRISPDEKIGSIPLRNIFENSPNHIVILGQPGAGKTTSMKYLCRLLLHEEDFRRRFSFPILIKCRDADNATISSNSGLITDQILSILGLRVDFPKELHEEEAKVQRQSLREKVVLGFLEELRVLLILDGFDEVAHDHNRNTVIKEIARFASHLDHSALIVTSRTGEFNYSLDNADQYEICPLDSTQISTFAIRWLKSKKKAAEFLMKVNNTPFADTAIRPLTLAHLCAIYERIQDIPEKPKTVYKKIVTLLLEDWDQQRTVTRVSRYAHFEVDRKMEFLCHIAYQLTTALQKTTFSTQNLLDIYREVYEEYGLPKGEAHLVVNELEAHNGLFLQTGFEQYEFAHKSLQEFLTAEFLVKLPSIPSSWNILDLLPNELAIAISISSSPSSYFIELVLNRYKFHKITDVFARAFLNRLLIEKPNFKPSTWLDLALLILYSKYIESSVILREKPESIQPDLILNEFLEMADAVSSNSIRDVLGCYEISQTYDTRDDDSIHQLRRVQEPADYMHPVAHAGLPELLYLRASFLTKEGSVNG